MTTLPLGASYRGTRSSQRPLKAMVEATPLVNCFIARWPIRSAFGAIGVLALFAILSNISLLNLQHERSRYNADFKMQQEDTDFLYTLDRTQTTSPDVMTKSARSPGVAKAPFEAGEPKQLLVLAYQRTGSTFFGKIFDSDPHALYVYEPLDGVYTSMYGTRRGWVVPTDIYHFPDGTPRTPPDYEVAAVESALRGLFSCNPRMLPVEMLTHPFYGQFRLNRTLGYSRCLMRHGLFAQCGEKLHARCLLRFGADKNAMAMCRSQISRLNTTVAGVLEYAARHDVSNDNDPEMTTTPDGSKFYRRVRRDFPNAVEEGSPRKRRRRPNRAPDRVVNEPINETEFHFNNYVRCLSAKAGMLVDCFSEFISSCSSSNLRVVKLVRGEMRNVDALMRMSRNFRLVHLIRDPRGVISSRRRLPFFYSIGVRRRDMVPEASYYCEDVIRDIRLRRELEARYPGRILQVIYDDFVTNAHESVRRIYDFLERSLPAEVVAFVNTTKPGTALSWKAKLNDVLVEQIDIACKGLYEILSENDTFNFRNEIAAPG